MSDTVNQAMEPTGNPAPEASIEDRILGVMEGSSEPEAPEQESQEVEQEQPEEAPEEEGQAEEAKQELAEVEVDGEIWQVPPAIKAKLDMANDYTRKTMEVANQRKEVEAQKQSIEQERKNFQQQVQLNQQDLQIRAKLEAVDMQIAQYGAIDWNQLTEQDPVRALQLERAYRELKDSRNGLIQEGLQLREQFQIAQQQNQAKAIQENLNVLTRDIPEWNADYYQALMTYVVNDYGFTPQEAGEAIDARAWKLAHKAYQYDKLMATKPQALNKVSVAPKVVKAGAPQPKQNSTEVLKKIVKTSTDKTTKNNAIQRLLEAKFK